MKLTATLFSGSRVEAYDLNSDPLKPWSVLAEMGLQPLNSNVP